MLVIIDRNQTAMFVIYEHEFRLNDYEYEF